MAPRVQELWDASASAFDDPEVAKTVAEAALQDGAFADINEVQDNLAGLNFQEVGDTAAVPNEPAFRDTGTAGSSDEEEPEELPAWTCACAPNGAPISA